MRTSFVNYRRALPLASLFAAASIAAATLFIIYAAKWNVTDNKLLTGQPGSEAYENETKARYSYYGAVVSLLMLIVFFNGYHLTKFK